MKIVDIFAHVKNTLLADQFESNDCDEFTLAFRNWSDTEYLEDFFENNKKDLRSLRWCWFWRLPALSS